MMDKVWGVCKADYHKVCSFVKKAVMPVVASTALVVTTSSVAVVTSSFVVTEVVQAGVDFTDVAVSTTDIFTFAGIILAAIGAIWGIKKLIGMGNKS